MGTGNYSTTSNNTKLVHWPLTGGPLQLVQRGGSGRGSHFNNHRTAVLCAAVL